MKTKSLSDWTRRAVMTLLAVITTTAAWAWEREAPKYYIECCKGGLGDVCVSGWAYDPYHGDLTLDVVVSTAPDVENDPDNVYDDIHSEWYPLSTEFVYREDVNSQFNLTGNHGFRVKLSITDACLPWFGEDMEKTLYVKIYARTIEYNEDNPNCKDYEFLLNAPYTTVTVKKTTGFGTEYSPYVISNAGEWDTIADIFADNDLAPFYPNCYFRMACAEEDGIDYDSSTPVTKMWGTSSHPFSGHFDGKGKTLYVNISSNEQFVAPFAFVNGATIYDLKVLGTVRCSFYAGGIVGNAAGTLSVERCICGVSINGFSSYAGGLVGWCDNLVLNLKNCLFRGSFSPNPDSEAYSQPVGCKDAGKPFTANIDEVYYVYSETSLYNAIIGIKGVPVNTSFVLGKWYKEMVLIDGHKYYGSDSSWLDDIWDSETGTLTVNSNPGTVYATNLNIRHLIIGSEVTVLDNQAFVNCDNIETVTFREGSQLESIGKNAFVDTKIKEIIIPASVRTIDSNAFAYCKDLKSFTAAEGSQLESLSEYVFAACEKLSLIAFLGVTPPETDYRAFAPGIDPSKITFYLHGDEYKKGDFWGEVYETGRYWTIVNKLTVGPDVAVVSSPTFTSEGNTYYAEGTAISLPPGNYTVMDAEGNDIKSTVLSGTTLTMPSCDVTITGKSNVEDDLTISTEEEWNTFASKVNGGASFIISTVTLAADISVSTMVGTAEHPFNGTFDGNGHTLTVSISSTDECAAPFRYIDQATIKDLNVTGTVSSSGNYAAGLVGGCTTANTISGCTVSTVVSGAPNAGGIVGFGGSDQLTLESCVFDGNISGFTHYAGGLMGWCDDLTLTVNNCMMMGTFTPEESGKCHPIACKSDGSTVVATANRVYYLYTTAPTAMGDFLIAGAEGIPVSAMPEAGAWDEPLTGVDGNTYYSTHVVGKSLPYEYGFETVLATEGWTLVGNSTDSSIISLNSHSGSSSFSFISGDDFQYLISPKIDTESSVKMSFYYTQIKNGTMQVGHSTTNRDISSFIWSEYWFEGQKDWTRYLGFFPRGTKYIAFRCSGSDQVEIDDISFEACDGIPPTNLTVNNLSETEGTLTWTCPDATAIGFAYQYKKTAEKNWPDEVTITDMSVTLSSLADDTEYDFRVKALFAENKFSDYVTVRFFTDRYPVTLPYTASFENGMDGWRIVDGDSNTAIVSLASDYVFDGTHSFRFGGSSHEQYLISPQLDIDPSQDWYLSFAFRNYNLEATENETNNASFQLGYSMTKDIDDFVWLSQMSCSNRWITMNLNLPLHAKYVAIKWVRGNDMLFDKFILKELDKIPTQIAATDVAATGADVSWAGSSESFGLRYREKAWLHQDFESGEDGLGKGWSSFEENSNFLPPTAQTSWQRFKSNGNYYAVSINYRTVINDNSNTTSTEILDLDDWLYTPKIPLTGNLTFLAKFKPLTADYDGEYDKVEVLVCTRNFYQSAASSDHIVIASIEPMTSDLNDDNYYCISLDSFDGREGYIAFRHKSKHKSILYIDDVSVFRTSDDWVTVQTTENNIRLRGLRPLTSYEYQVQSVLSNVSFDWSDLGTFTTEDYIPLANKNDITATANGHKHDVKLQGLAFYRNREWNTLCLPFGVSDFGGTPLEGATVKALSSSDFSGNKLTLNFTEATNIEAGKPYIVKWPDGAGPFPVYTENPVFDGVTVVNDDPTAVTFSEGQFVGTYGPIANTNDMLLDALNAGNGAFHAALGFDRSVLGDDFAGWYTDAAMSKPATTIPFDADGNVTLYAGWGVELADAADNTATIEAVVGSGKTDNKVVVINGRTLSRDGEWNTLCLPFSMNATQIASSSLADATIMELNGETSNLTGGTLTLNFTPVSPSGEQGVHIESGRPYLVKWTNGAKLVISSDDDWAAFAQRVAAGETFAGKNVLLDADISVSAMVGTADHPFCGTFDGNGHTLNVSIDDAGADYAAPFRYIRGATIRNVRVEGSVNGGDYCAGLVGAALGGTNSIRNCWMAASVSGQSNIGGVLGHGNASATNISNCYLTGHLNANYIGVFCGGGSAGGRHTVETCWANGSYPDFLQVVIDENVPCNGDINLVRADGGTVSVNNCRQNIKYGLPGYYTGFEVIVVIDGGSVDDRFVDFLGSQWTLNDNGRLTMKPSADIIAADIENPFFPGVTIGGDAPVAVTFAGGQFLGSYNPVGLTTSDLLFSDNSTVGHPADATTLNACRAYFQLDDAGAAVTSVVLNFNDGAVLMGDVNGDNKVTPADAIMILYRYFGVEQNGFNEAVADLNGDNSITPADAIEALYKYFGAGSNGARATRPMETGAKDPE